MKSNMILLGLAADDLSLLMKVFDTVQTWSVSVYNSGFSSVIFQGVKGRAECNAFQVYRLRVDLFRSCFGTQNGI